MYHIDVKKLVISYVVLVPAVVISGIIIGRSAAAIADTIYTLVCVLVMLIISLEKDGHDD